LLFIYSLILLSQLDTKQYPTVPHVLTWAVGLAFEAVLLALNFVNHGSREHQLSSYKYTALGIDIFRIVILFILISVYITLVVLSAEVQDDGIEDEDHGDSDSDEQPEGEDYDESTGLLAPSGVSVSTERRRRRANGTRKRGDYGTITNGKGKLNGKGKAGPSQLETGTAGWARRNVIGVRQSWWEYLRGYAVCTTAIRKAGMKVTDFDL